MFNLSTTRKWLRTAVFSMFILGLFTVFQSAATPSIARGVETYPANKFQVNKTKSKRKAIKARNSRKIRNVRKTRKAVSNRKIRRHKRSFGRKTRSKRALRRPASRHAHKITRRVSGARGLHPRLRRLLSRVRAHYGRPVIISSGCRSHRHNRRIGGARRSLHLSCMAADFKVVGVSKRALARYVSSLPGRGGVGTYCGRSIVHLDVGPYRTWYHGCRKKRRKRG